MDVGTEQSSGCAMILRTNAWIRVVWAICPVYRLDFGRASRQTMGVLARCPALLEDSARVSAEQMCRQWLRDGVWWARVCSRDPQDQEALSAFSERGLVCACSECLSDSLFLLFSELWDRATKKQRAEACCAAAKSGCIAALTLMKCFGYLEWPLKAIRIAADENQQKCLAFLLNNPRVTYFGSFQ